MKNTTMVLIEIFYLADQIRFQVRKYVYIWIGYECEHLRRNIVIVTIVVGCICSTLESYDYVFVGIIAIKIFTSLLS